MNNRNAVISFATDASNGGKLKFYDPVEIYNYPVYLDEVRFIQNNGAYNYRDNGFFLCDINNDDTPELFVTFTPDDDGIIFAGSIVNDELVTFYEMMGAGGVRGITLYDNGYIGLDSITGSLWGTTISKYDGGKGVTNVISVSHDLDPKATDKYSKYLNNRSYSITESEYNSILDQYNKASFTAHLIPMPYIQNDIRYDYYFDYYEATSYTGTATSITIPNSINGLPVTTINKFFIFDDSNVLTLNLSANITNIDPIGVSGASLREINIDSSNPYFISKDGVVYNKYMTTLVKYPSAKDASSFIIPDSVNEIGPYAFAWCTAIKRIIIPKNVNTIQGLAFHSCPNLTSITIENNNCEIYDYWDDEIGATICNSYDIINGECKYLGVIYGEFDSSAQVYAETFDRTFVLLDPYIYYTTAATTTTTTSSKATTTTTTTTATYTTQEVTSTTNVNRAEAGPAKGDLSIFSNIDADNADVKPILSLSRIELSQEEAIVGPVCNIELTVSGAESKYANTGIHIFWDSRLTLEGSEDDITRGSALNRVALYDVVKNGSNGIFVCSGSTKNNGKDGVMISFSLRIPSDCKSGDFYPIEIEYMNSVGANDIFIDVDKTNHDMEAWVFTKGIIHGYIKIKDEEPTLEYNLGDVTRDGSINAVDASSVLAYYAMIATNKDGGYDDAQKLAADVNHDGAINAVDASCILAYYAYASTTKDEVLSLELYFKRIK